MSVIKPTLGRMVWYRPWPAEGMAVSSNGFCSAQVVEVLSDQIVNLVVDDARGQRHVALGVRLVQENEENPGGGFCCWMPYQIGQAKAAAGK